MRAILLDGLRKRGSSVPTEEDPEPTVCDCLLKLLQSFWFRLLLKLPKSGQNLRFALLVMNFVKDFHIMGCEVISLIKTVSVSTITFSCFNIVFDQHP